MRNLLNPSVDDMFESLQIATQLEAATSPDRKSYQKNGVGGSGLPSLGSPKRTNTPSSRKYVEYTRGTPLCGGGGG